MTFWKVTKPHVFIFIEGMYTCTSSSNHYIQHRDADLTSKSLTVYAESEIPSTLPQEAIP